MFFVYIYVDPRTNTPCYVGKGRGRRDKDHLRGSHNTRLNKLINELKTSGLQPKITKIEEGLTNAEAIVLEVKTIAKYGRKGYEAGGVLMNHTLGGEGASGRVLSKESREKLSVSNKGKKRSDTAKENIRKATQEYFDLHPEAGAAHSARLKGRPCPESVKINLSLHFSKARRGSGNPAAKSWIVKSPNGELFQTDELVQFCSERGLSYVGLKAGMRAGREVKKGKSRGWSLSILS